MAMKVPGNTGAAGAAEIEAHIEAIGSNRLGKDILGKGDQVHHLEAFIRFHVLNMGHFAEGYNKEVAGVVGIAVEEEVVEGGAVDDKCFPVIAEGRKIAKGALDAFHGILPGGDVVHSPVCVQYVHAGRKE